MKTGGRFLQVEEVQLITQSWVRDVDVGGWSRLWWMWDGYSGPVWRSKAGDLVCIFMTWHIFCHPAGSQGLLSRGMLKWKLSCMIATWWPGDGVGGWQQLDPDDVFPLVAVWALDRNWQLCVRECWGQAREGVLCVSFVFDMKQCFVCLMCKCMRMYECVWNIMKMCL